MQLVESAGKLSHVSQATIDFGLVFDSAEKVNNYISYDWLDYVVEPGGLVCSDSEHKFEAKDNSMLLF